MPHKELNNAVNMECPWRGFFKGAINFCCLGTVPQSQGS